MSSKTIEEAIAKYRVGEKLRALRRKKSMGLVQLSSHTGLSPAMLSKLERDKMIPTLPTLLRIAMVFGVGLDFFFSPETEEPEFSVVRRDERIRLPNDPKSSAPVFEFESLDFRAHNRPFSCYLAEFPGGNGDGSTPRHEHPGVEFLYVLSGRLQVSTTHRSASLAAGDSLYFDSSLPHDYRAEGENRCRVLVLTSPR